MNTKVDQETTVLGPDFSMGRRIAAFLSILLVYFFYCYNWMVDIFVRPTLLSEYGFSLTQAESIYSMLSYGTVPGTIICGMLATRFGKKRTLMGIALLFSSMTFLPLINPSSQLLWMAGRLATGLALGGVFGTAIPLVADLFPQKYRGKLAAICTSTFSVAIMFSGQLYGMLGDANWKLLVMTAVVPPVLGVILMYFLVPDDASHMKKLREEAARENKKISYIEMYKGKYFFIGLGAILLSGANFIAYALYTNNATTYLTTVLGMTAATAGGIYSVQGIGQLIGYNFWGYISDKFGRRMPLIGMALTGACIFVFNQLNASSVTLFYVLSFMTGFLFGFSGAWGAYYAELFPEKFRTLSSGISFNGGKILLATLAPLLTALAGGSMNTIFFISMTVVVLGAVLWFFLPETLVKKPAEDKKEKLKYA